MSLLPPSALDQQVEEVIEVGRDLTGTIGPELDADHERVVGAFDRFYDSVLDRVGGGHQIGGALGVSHSHPMQAVHPHEAARSDDGRQLASGRNVDVVASRFVLVPFVAGHGARPLAPHRHVQRVHPVAYCHDGQIEVEHCGQESRHGVVEHQRRAVIEVGGRVPQQEATDEAKLIVTLNRVGRDEERNASAAADEVTEEPAIVLGAGGNGDYGLIGQ